MKTFHDNIIELCKIKQLVSTLYPYKKLKFYELFNVLFDRKKFNSKEINNAAIFLTIAIEGAYGDFKITQKELDKVKAISLRSNRPSKKVHILLSRLVALRKEIDPHQYGHYYLYMTKAEEALKAEIKRTEKD